MARYSYRIEQIVVPEPESKVIGDRVAIHAQSVDLGGRRIVAVLEQQRTLIREPGKPGTWDLTVLTETVNPLL